MSYGKQQEMKDKKGINSVLHYLVLVSQLGIIMVSSVVICLFIGLYLDNKLGTNGVFITIFILLGILAGFWNDYRLIVKSNLIFNDENKQTEQQRKE